MKLFWAVLLLIAGLLPDVSAFGQDNIGVKFFGLSIHPKGEKENALLMPNRLDENGFFVLNLGAEWMYEKFVVEDRISVKLVQALYADCAARLGGFFHVGLRGKIFQIKRHSFSGGIGPTLVFRRNWMEMDGYENLNRFKGDESAKWQYLFLWYGGELEYKYHLTEKLDAAISFVPGYPDLMSLSIGVNYKFRKKE